MSELRVVARDNVPVLIQWVDADGRPQHVTEVRFDQERIEAKLDALIHALKAGAVGRWQ